MPLMNFLERNADNVIAALLSCLFLYCRICVVIIVSSALANYK